MKINKFLKNVRNNIYFLFLNDKLYRYYNNNNNNNNNNN